MRALNDDDWHAYFGAGLVGGEVSSICILPGLKMLAWEFTLGHYS